MPLLLLSTHSHTFNQVLLVPRILTTAMLEEGEEEVEEDEEKGERQEGPPMAKAGAGARRGSFAFWMATSGGGRGGGSALSSKAGGGEAAGSTGGPRKSHSGSGAMEALLGTVGRPPRILPPTSIASAVSSTAPSRLPSSALTVSAPIPHLDLHAYGYLPKRDGVETGGAGDTTESEVQAVGGTDVVPLAASMMKIVAPPEEGLQDGASQPRELFDGASQPVSTSAISRSEPNLKNLPLSKDEIQGIQLPSSPPRPSPDIEAMGGGVLMQAVAMMRHPDDTSASPLTPVTLEALGSAGYSRGSARNSGEAGSMISDSEKLRLAYLQRYRCV